MTINIDGQSLQIVIARLSKTERGRSAMRHILAWMDDDGLGLDGPNKGAAISLIRLIWECPGSGRDAVRDALGD